ncbi:MAG: hypothetical protein ACYCO3_06835 [Mycobacteriales bacterium]
MSPRPVVAPGPALARLDSVSRLGRTVDLTVSPVTGGSPSEVTLAPEARLMAGTQYVGLRALIRGSLWRLTYNNSGEIARASLVRR